MYYQPNQNHFYNDVNICRPDATVGFQKGNKFLNFELEGDSPYMADKYKITNEDKTCFEQTGRHFNFLFIIDNWKVVPNENIIVGTAKYAIFLAHILGGKGVDALVEVLDCRMNETVPALSSWRVTLLYLIHVIMAIETVNYDFRSGPGRPFCSKFETMLTDRKRDIFRRLVMEAPSIERRQELYSIRYKWETYFTKAGLVSIDRLNFWVQAGKASPQPQSLPTVTVAKDCTRVPLCPTVSANSRTPQNPVSVNNSGTGTPRKNKKPANAVTPQVRILEIDLTSPSSPRKITTPKTSTQNCTVTSKAITSENVVQYWIQSSEDLLLALIPIIETFLNVDWLDNFPLSEEDKRNFTDRYSVKKPSGKNVVVLYNKKVEFCMAKFENSKRVAVSSAEKDKFIAAAKEAHFIAKVFGKNEVSAVSEMLTADMAVSSERINSKQDRLKSLLLVHIILYAEATQSSYKDKLKISRPFSNAFSTEAFVSCFRKLVTFSCNTAIKQNLYWMRLRWNSCLLDEFLYKIDDGDLWTKNRVKLCEVPANLNRKNIFIEESGEEVSIIAQIDKSSVREEVAVVELLSSDEEGEILSDEGAPVTCVDNNPRIKQNSQSYVGLFKTSRYNLWNAKFFVDDYCLSKLRQKYNFPTNCDAEDKSLKQMALELFSKTVHEVLPSINEPKFLNLAKEAFYIETFDAVNEVARFLVQIMEEGFEYCKSEETKLTSRLIGFLMIHTIIAIESVEPLIVPGFTRRWYLESFEDQHLYSSAKILIRKIGSKELRSKLKFLRLTWAAGDESNISERLKAKFKDNYKNEGSFVKDVLEFVKQKYESNKAIFDKEKSRCKRSVDELEPDSSDGSNFQINSSKKSRRSQRKDGHVESWKNLEHFGTPRGEAERNETMTKKATTRQLFVPDIIQPLPSTSQNSGTSGSSERHGKKSHVSGNASGSLSITPAGLEGINGKPMRLESSQHGKEIENLRKMLQERNKKKKAKGAQEDWVHAPPTIAEVQIDNFESGDFLDN